MRLLPFKSIHKTNDKGQLRPLRKRLSKAAQARRAERIERRLERGDKPKYENKD